MDEAINSGQPKIGLLILAAGASGRMNEPKQLLPFEGNTLLRRAVLTATETLYSPVIVILGANFDLIKAEIEDLPVEIIFNKDWSSGLSSSIKTGIENLLRIAPETTAALITLADQPFVTARHLNLFADKFHQSNNPIIAAAYDRTYGVPALFACSVFEDLRSLSGDQGAKPMIEKYRAALAVIELPEAAFDIDTPQDFARLQS